MITIVFSQCTELPFSDWDRAFYHLPTNDRIERYKTILLTRDTYLFHTYDEHLILVAQKLVRENKLKPGTKIKLISVCKCEKRSEGVIESNGDIPDSFTFHHSYVKQKLELLNAKED